MHFAIVSLDATSVQLSDAFVKLWKGNVISSGAREILLLKLLSFVNLISGKGSTVHFSGLS
jgi:hypothetical protein